MADKDARGYLAAIADVTDSLVLMRPSTPRAAAPEDVAVVASELGIPNRVVPSAGAAVQSALAEAGEADLVLITGSHYTVGDAMVSLGVGRLCGSVSDALEVQMAKVVVKGVSKVFDGNVVAVKDMSLVVEDREFVVLVGPSGCGKSTLLRMVAGLEEVTSGEIYIDDRLVNDVPPKDRDIAMVFQNYALYPHMTVYENMAFGLKLRKYPKAEIDARVREAAEILGISAFLDRRPKALSGGQRQRVAVGRAIVRKPKVFLFDEPLSNLDAKLRVQTRTQIIKLHDRLKATIIYVTHDQVEAMTMGTRIVVMKDGVSHQVAAPLTVYQRPVDQFVAGFIGSPAMNFIEGSLSDARGQASCSRPTGSRLRSRRNRPGRSRPIAGRRSCSGSGPRTSTRPPTRAASPSRRG